MRNKNLVLASVLILLIAVLAYLWIDPGYGSVSPKAYEIAKALYSAAQKKSDAHLEKVEQILQESHEELSSSEQSWLLGMVQDAHQGNWQATSKAARRMLDDQVQR